MDNAFGLKDKVALVTGGAGGIGSAVVRLLAERGARVAIANFTLERAEALSASIGEDRAFAVHVDLADESSIAAMVAATVDRFGGLDILHNNAAALSPELTHQDLDVLSMKAEVWDRTFAINCRGAMLTIRECLPHLIASRGSIVTTTSNTGLQGYFVLSAYTASKAALLQLTRAVAASYGHLGVRCNSVAPGLTITPAMAAATDPFSTTLKQVIKEETLLPELGVPEDIAQVVAFLASDAARNITGQTIVADGGLSSTAPGSERLRTMMAG